MTSDPPLIRSMSRMVNALRTSGGFLTDAEMGEAVWCDREEWPVSWRTLLLGYGCTLRKLGFPVKKCRGHGWRWGT